jgi:Zn-dependent protease
VYLHWSWFAIALFEISNRAPRYSGPGWNALEYVSLFLIVLMHEFGHALACRQVGGQADQIVLWPLGGVAYVSPPQRPGAVFWSIAAGPLVNVGLFPIFSILLALAQSRGWSDSSPDAYSFVRTLWILNAALLVFNLLPIYPLDGGQILRSLLWFFIGRSRSLMAASIVGFAGVAMLIVCALLIRSIWLGILAAFILINCRGGLLQARALARAEAAPRREGLACPVCKSPPPQGVFWVCGNCRKGFDAFETSGACPNCGARFNVTRCLECGGLASFEDWKAPRMATSG